jgi:hypothetical protein
MNDYEIALEEHIIESERRRRESPFAWVLLAVMGVLALVAYVEHQFPRDDTFVPGGLR